MSGACVLLQLRTITSSHRRHWRSPHPWSHPSDFQMNGCEKEGPLQQRVSSSLKQKEPHPPHVKEEEEEVWISQEGECFLGQEEAGLTKFPLTVVSVKTEDHEDKPPESSHLHHSPNIQRLIGRQEERVPQPQKESFTLKQKEPQPRHLKEEEPQLPHIKEDNSKQSPPLKGGEPKPHHVKKEELEPKPPYVKEEEEEVWISQEEECLLGQVGADLTKFPLTVVSVKTEEHEDKPPECSQLHHSPSDENIEVEPSSSSSPKHMTTEADGDHCGGPQADKILAPLSDSDDITSDVDVNMESHLRTHTEEKHFSCSFCGKGFMSKCHIEAHMRTHTGEKPFGCSVCAKGFVVKSNLTRHMKIHTGEKPFSCSVCCKQFSLKGRMQTHMSTHTGENNFGCSVCGKQFVYKSNMLIHASKHAGEKLFACSVCGKRFFTKHHMERHKTTHTGEKPFSCSECGKRFSHRSNIQRHKRKHTEEQAFSCSVCTKRFSHKSSMQRHMGTHTGEKPFNCSVCAKRFSHKSSMQRHMGAHTGQ
ncbi:zinc finger protein 391-like isoform X1 [Nerophis ophidion]|uniref:zinc finger protein 391-like isoform X1 n=2 Tax=Nerophis ophidion TaxID=159077 RepID=UPI002ADF0C4C|nr:zinc finger protein 391-like isoform X1 [Nerophis ophidion]